MKIVFIFGGMAAVLLVGCVARPDKPRPMPLVVLTQPPPPTHQANPLVVNTTNVGPRTADTNARAVAVPTPTEATLVGGGNGQPIQAAPTTADPPALPKVSDPFAVPTPFLTDRPWVPRVPSDVVVSCWNRIRGDSAAAIGAWATPKEIPDSVRLVAYESRWRINGLPIPGYKRVDLIDSTANIVPNLGGRPSLRPQNGGSGWFDVRPVYEWRKTHGGDGGEYRPATVSRPYICMGTTRRQRAGSRIDDQTWSSFR